MSRLQSIPIEALDYITGYLLPSDALALSLVSSEWLRLVRHCVSLWEPVLLERFPYSSPALISKWHTIRSQTYHDGFVPYCHGIDYVRVLGCLLRNKYVSFLSNEAEKEKSTERKTSSADDLTALISSGWGMAKSMFVPTKQPVVLLLGMAKSGKSELVQLMKAHIPRRASVMGITVNFLGLSIWVWEFTAANLLRRYLQKAKRVVFTIDSSADADSYKKTLAALEIICQGKYVTEEMPFLILANMQDVPGARSAERVAFDVAPFLGEKRLWRVQGASKSNFDYTVKGLEWLKCRPNICV